MIALQSESKKSPPSFIRLPSLATTLFFSFLPRFSLLSAMMLSARRSRMAVDIILRPDVRDLLLDTNQLAAWRCGV